MAEDAFRATGITENKIRDMFDMFDADGGGTIDCDELTAAFVSLGISDTKEEIDQLVEQIDTDGSGVIEYEEFREVIVQLLSQRDSVSEIHKAFTYFAEGKERITLNDLRKISIDIPDIRTEQFLEEMFAVGDVDCDSVITFQDFRTIMENAIAHERSGLTDPKKVLDEANESDGLKL